MKYFAVATFIFGQTTGHRITDFSSVKYVCFQEYIVCLLLLLLLLFFVLLSVVSFRYFAVATFF